MAREEFFVVCQAGCGKRYTFDIDPEDYERFRQGTYAQVAFPYLTADQRELMVSQTCGECFDRMFPEDLDDDAPAPGFDHDEFTDEQWAEFLASLAQWLGGEVLPAKTLEEEKEQDGTV